MARRRGLQAEVLVSLAVVMLTATTVLGALLAKAHDANVRQLQRLAARSLLVDAHAPLPTASAAAPELRWWTLTAEGRARPRGAEAGPIDPGSRAVAEAARERGRPLLRAGAPWEGVRFAAPVEGGVAVAWLPPPASGTTLLGVLAAEVAVFTAFGASLLRGRLVRPLQRLAGAARAIADGELGARVPAEGPRETWELATTFNEMCEALETRTEALEKAVWELRESNQNLRTARAGLDRAERLAAVGRLAAGVAHEVGNPMGAMLAFLELARRDGSLSAPARGHLERAMREGERVRVILRQLLDFSRPRRSESAPVDLVVVAEETAELMRAQRRYRNLVIDIAPEGEPPLALTDRNGVTQILLNLLINAGDALADAPGEARVQIGVRPAVSCTRAGEGAGAAHARRDFDAVECVVADNGPGISPEDRERIFDPFFTTKAPGEGTGLGLSNAVRLAEELGGSLELDPEASSEGATFVLRLPGASDAPGQGRARTSA
jgi:signal transduction histidine kinase